jgi:excisionase family DNA binding protein
LQEAFDSVVTKGGCQVLSPIRKEGFMVREQQSVFTTGEVARICKVAPQTVSKWIDSGRLKGYRIPGSRDRRVPKNDLIGFLALHGMPLGQLKQNGLTIMVVGNGHMTSIADRIATLIGKEMSIERCDNFFQAGLRFGDGGDGRIHVLVVDVAANGLQETVKFIRTLDGSPLVLAVRVAGSAFEVEGIDEYFTPEAAPELVIKRVHQLLRGMGFNFDAM